MSSRTIPLVSGQIYHIFNRGVEKRIIFHTKRDYQRFLKTLRYYRVEGPKPKFSKFSQPKTVNLDFSKKIVEILAYCLMPNHFHLLIKQVRDNGITEFISKVTNSYTKYYNTKYKRVGPLFQGEFKSVLVESDNQLIHLSRYIHLNPIVSYLVKNLEEYEWSSYKEYINNSQQSLCSLTEVLNFFNDKDVYKQFVLDQISYGQELELIKHKLIEEV